MCASHLECLQAAVSERLGERGRVS
jgi:hypothetical protein